MDKKIEIQIYGYWSKLLGSKDFSSGCGGCSSKSGGETSGCEGCGSKHRISLSSDNKDTLHKNSSCGGCGNKVSKTTGEHYEELAQFIRESDISDYVNLEFLNLDKINILDYDNIRILDEFEYEDPYVVIDDIVRYYGGISNSLIYNDIKELIE